MNKLKIKYVSYPLIKFNDVHDPEKWAIAMESQLNDIDPKNIVAINYLGSNDDANGDKDITRFAVFYHK